MSENHGEESSRRMHAEHEAHEEGEPWLVSYADMMTLLFGFFVLMYSFAAAKLENFPADMDQMVLLRKEIASYFGGEYIEPLKNVSDEFSKSIKGSALDENVNTKLSPEGLEVTIQSTATFASGSAELYPAAHKAVQQLIAILQENSGREIGNLRVQVEGHTDDVPLGKSNKHFPSNWELSAARASTVIRIFEEAGFNPTNLIAIGYGSTRPLFPNRDQKGQPIAQNQERNRRVKIRVASVDSKAGSEPAIQ